MKSAKFSAPRTHLSPRKQPPCWTWRFQANFQHLPLGPMKPWQGENGSHQGHDEIVAKSGFVKWMPDSHGFTPTKNPWKNPNPVHPTTTNHQPAKLGPCLDAAAQFCLSFRARSDVVMSWCRDVVESSLDRVGNPRHCRTNCSQARWAAQSCQGTKSAASGFGSVETLKKKFPPNSCRMYRCVTSKARCIFNSDSKLESTNPILTTKQFTPGSGKKTRRVSLRSRTKLWSAAWKNPVSWLGWASPLVVASESPRQWKAPLLVSTGMPGNGGSLGEFIYLGSRVTTFDCKWSNAALKWKQSNSAMFHGSWRRDLSCLFASVSLVTFKATWESLVSRYPNASGLSLFCSALPDFGPSNKSSNKGLRSILTFDGLETALKRPDNKHPTTGWVA